MTGFYDRDVFWQSVLVLAFFSAVCSLFIIVSILLQWRKDFSSRLVLHLSIADFGLSSICFCLCAYNYHYGHLQNQSNFVCQFQPFVTWYFMEVSILWLTVIAINSYKVIFYHEPLSKNQEVVVSILCWCIPAISAALPLLPNAGQSYGPRNDLWCSFSETKKGAQFANIMIYYLPCLIIIGACYVRIIIEIIKIQRKNEEKTEVMNNKLAIIRRMFLFVAAYFIVWTPMAISYIYEFNTGNYISFIAEIIVDNLLHFQGILNFILYGINNSLAQKLYSWLMNRWDSFGRSFSKGESKAESRESRRDGTTSLPNSEEIDVELGTTSAN